MRGTILTNLAPDEEKRHNAERAEDNAAHATERAEDRRREAHKVWLERLTLAAVIIYATITFWQGCLTKQIAELTQRTYETSQRPYIGVNDVKPNWIFASDANQERSFDDAIGMEFMTIIKNFGPVPGTDFAPSWRIFVNDVEQKTDKIPDTPTTLYPGGQVALKSQIGKEAVQRLLKGEDTLEVEITIRYSGPTGAYPTECGKHRFLAHGFNTFADLGQCTHGR